MAPRPTVIRSRLMMITAPHFTLLKVIALLRQAKCTLTFTAVHQPFPLPAACKDPAVQFIARTRRVACFIFFQKNRPGEGFSINVIGKVVDCGVQIIAVGHRDQAVYVCLNRLQVSAQQSVAFLDGIGAASCLQGDRSVPVYLPLFGSASGC